MNQRFHSFLQFLRRSHIPLLAGVLFVYVAVATGYTFRLQPSFLKPHDYFGLQAEAWMNGRLDLPLEKPMIDMSPYDGRIHLYWGPTNIFLPFILRLLTGHDAGMIIRTIIYCLSGILTFAFILDLLHKRFFPKAPFWLPGIFSSALAFSSPVPTLVYRAGAVYSESIALSFFLQMLILYTWLRLSITASKASAAGFGIAGALAIGARITNIIFLAPLYVVRLIPRPATPLSRLLFASVFLVTVAGGLMAYNAVRFDTPFESGFDFADGAPKLRALLAQENAVLTPRWIPRNFYIYALRLPPREDFINKLAFPWPFPAWPGMEEFTIPDDQLYVDTHSTLLLTPLLLLFVLLPFCRFQGESARVALGLAGAFLGQILFLLCYAWASRRFTVDFVPVGLLLAYIAAAGFLIRRPAASEHLRSASLLLLTGGIAITFLILKAGATKTMRQMLVTEDLRMPSPAWPALLIAVILLSVASEIYISPPKVAAAESERI